MKFLEYRDDPATGLSCCMHCDAPLKSDAFVAGIGAEESDDGKPFVILLCVPDCQNKFQFHFVMVGTNDGGDGQYHRR